MTKRITGTEMEWPAYEFGSGSNTGQFQAHKFDPFVRAYVQQHDLADPPPGCSNLYMKNGSRFYVDLGGQREYATPEDDSIIDTVANEIAGERIVYGALRMVLENHDPKTLENVKSFKRVIDKSDNTWGYHQNLLADLNTYRDNKSNRQYNEIISESGLALMGLHMATYNIFAGAGTLRSDGTYSIAQKALDIKDDFSQATTNNKPVINLRNEALGDSNKFRRIHITSGDANILPWAMRMSLGTKSIVLSMIEQGYDLRSLRLKRPLDATMRAVARDPELKNGYELENGKKLSAIGIQKVLAKIGCDLDRNNQLSDEEQWTLEQWQKALSDLEQNPDLLIGKSDWVTKFYLIKNYREKHGFSPDHPKLRNIDMLYDENSPAGLGMKYRQGPAGKYMPPEELIASRMIYPPATTRAHLRGNSARNHPGVVEINDWQTVRVNGQAITLKDPTSNTNQELNKAIYEAEQKRGISARTA